MRFYETVLCLRIPLIIGALLLVGCGPRAVPGTPTLVGVIVSVNGVRAGGQGAPRVHVKTTSEDPCGIIFSVDAGTEILTRDARDRLAEVPLDSLTRGRSVRVWSGPVAESCPGQSQAFTIELLATNARE